MARFILDVNQEWGTTIILIEHDMGVVMDISRPGRRARHGAARSPRARRTRCAPIPQVIKAYLGDAKNATSGGADWLISTTLAAAAAAQCPQTLGDRPAIREKDRGIWQTWTWRAVPRPGARPRARPGRARLRARRPALGHRRQSPAALLGAGRGAVPRRRRRAGLPGLDRQGARLRLEPRRGVRDRRRGPGAGRQDPRAQGRAARAAPRDLRRSARHARITTTRWLKSFDEVQEAGREFGAEHPGYFEAEIDKGKPDDVAHHLPTPLAPPATPRASCSPTRNAIAVAGSVLSQADDVRPEDDSLAYLPMAWAGDSVYTLFAQPAWSDSTSTAPRARRRCSATCASSVRPTVLAPPRIWENMLTAVQVRAADVAAPQAPDLRLLSRAVAERAEILRADGKPVPAGLRAGLRAR